MKNIKEYITILTTIEQQKILGGKSSYSNTTSASKELEEGLDWLLD